MSKGKVLQKAEKFEIQAYKNKYSDLVRLRKENIPFTGSLLHHPYDNEKVILISDPYSPNTSYYEFKLIDVSHLEELPNITNMAGETVTHCRIWVKKQTIGVKSTPFVVAETF